MSGENTPSATPQQPSTPQQAETPKSVDVYMTDLSGNLLRNQDGTPKKQTIIHGQPITLANGEEYTANIVKVGDSNLSLITFEPKDRDNPKLRWRVGTEGYVEGMDPIGFQFQNELSDDGKLVSRKAISDDQELYTETYDEQQRVSTRQRPSSDGSCLTHSYDWEHNKYISIRQNKDGKTTAVTEYTFSIAENGKQTESMLSGVEFGDNGKITKATKKAGDTEIDVLGQINKKIQEKGKEKLDQLGKEPVIPEGVEDDKKSDFKRRHFFQRMAVKEIYGPSTEGDRLNISPEEQQELDAYCNDPKYKEEYEKEKLAVGQEYQQSLAEEAGKAETVAEKAVYQEKANELGEKVPELKPKTEEGQELGNLWDKLQNANGLADVIYIIITELLKANVDSNGPNLLNTLFGVSENMGTENAGTENTPAEEQTTPVAENAGTENSAHAATALRQASGGPAQPAAPQTESAQKTQPAQGPVAPSNQGQEM